MMGAGGAAAALAAVILLVCGAGQAASQSGYRLAGVVATNNGSLGFVELPNGQQILVRVDDTVPDGGRVISLSDRGVHIAFPTGTLELTIDGVARKVTSSAAQVVQSGNYQGHVHVRSVEPAVLKQELAQPGSAITAGQEATQRRGRKDAAAELGQQFARVIDLPPKARVLAVNERSVTSADAAIAEINRTLASGMPARINLANASDVQHRIYLLPVPR